MCSHVWKKINDCFVCMRCGITRIQGDNKVIFDRKLPNYKSNKKKGGKK